MGQRRRFEGGVASPIVLLGKHAVPLTQSLGDEIERNKEVSMTTEYQYAAVPDKLKEFLEKIHNKTIGIPEKATYAWLESLGYKSSNDRSILRVLRFIGFIDEKGVPTDSWRLYRGAKHRQVLGKAVYTAYGELFSTYPRACEMSDADLESFFATKTSGGKQVVSRLVRTFKVLCALSDFSETGLEEPPSVPTIPLKAPKSGALRTFTPSIHIDIQIHISPEVSPEQIDKIFESMAKHIFKGEERS